MANGKRDQVVFRLRPGLSARRSAGGRNGARRWEIFAADVAPAWPENYDDMQAEAVLYLGDLVHFSPEDEWVWQPKDSLTLRNEVSGSDLVDVMGRAGLLPG